MHQAHMGLWACAANRFLQNKRVFKVVQPVELSTRIKDPLKHYDVAYHFRDTQAEGSMKFANGWVVTLLNIL